MPEAAPPPPPGGVSTADGYGAGSGGPSGMRRMTRERGKAGAARSGGETPRLLLPGDLPRSLRHLDDGQLEELLRAAGAGGAPARPGGGGDGPPPSRRIGIGGSRRAAAAPAGP